MAIDDKKKELAKKLQTLVERGATPGERAAAQRRLDRLMEKYGLDDADLDDMAQTIHWFEYKDARERQLFCQVCNKVDRDLEIWKINRGKGQRTKVGAKCTAAQAVQIGIEFDFYKELWAKEVDFFFRAFLQKHQIFDMSPGHKTNDCPMSKEELFRMGAMMNGMQDATLHPMIEGK